jgi:cephalosporin hydroxylase
MTHLTPAQIVDLYIVNRDTPSDINQHLPKLRDYYDRCDHVTEIGVRGCVSLSAALVSNAKKVVAIDILNVAVPFAEKLTFICGDSLKVEIEPTDFLFIDSLHTYDQLLAELTRHGSKARKYIGFHDTFIFGFNGEDGSKPGLNQAIDEFRMQQTRDHDTGWAVDYKTDNNNGLTILKRV